MSQRSFYYAVSVFFLCAVSACSTGSSTKGIYLQRIVQIDDERYYPDPLRVDDSDFLTATTLAEAISDLERALPIDLERIDAATAIRFCSFRSPMQWTSNFHECRQLLCAGLPAGSRDSDCGYLIRVQGWVESTWLGGLCSLQADRRGSDLMQWFRRRGMTECFQASEVVMAGLYQNLVGLEVAEAELIEAAK